MMFEWLSRFEWVILLGRRLGGHGPRFRRRTWGPRPLARKDAVAAVGWGFARGWGGLADAVKAAPRAPHSKVIRAGRWWDRLGWRGGRGLGRRGLRPR